MAPTLEQPPSPATTTNTNTTDTTTAPPPAHKFPASDFEQRFIPSQDLMVSCGCVPVDPAARKVALLHSARVTELPKGRKNIGEDLHAAALRETCEETGLTFDPLPLRIATRATPTADMLARPDAPPVAGPNLGDVTAWLPSCEPVAVCAYRCQSTLTSKLVFWYAAQGDSTAVPRDDTREVWEQHMQVEWVDARDAPGRMTYEADARVVEKVLDDMRRSGYDI